MLNDIADADEELHPDVEEGEPLANFEEDEPLLENPIQQEEQLQNLIQELRKHDFNLAQDLIAWAHQVCKLVWTTFRTNRSL